MLSFPSFEANFNNWQSRRMCARTFFGKGINMLIVIYTRGFMWKKPPLVLYTCLRGMQCLKLWSTAVVLQKNKIKLYVERETKRMNTLCVKQLSDSVIASLCFLTFQLFKPTAPLILLILHPQWAFSFLTQALFLSRNEQSSSLNLSHQLITSYSSLPSSHNLRKSSDPLSPSLCLLPSLCLSRSFTRWLLLSLQKLFTISKRHFSEMLGLLQCSLLC